MILYENTKATDGSIDRDTDFDVVAAVLQRDILAYFKDVPVVSWLSS